MSILVGCIIYQASKPIFGFAPDFETLATAAYWSGAALLIHWICGAKATEPRP